MKGIFHLKSMTIALVITKQSRLICIIFALTYLLIILREEIKTFVKHKFRPSNILFSRWKARTIFDSFESGTVPIYGDVMNMGLAKYECEYEYIKIVLANAKPNSPTSIFVIAIPNIFKLKFANTNIKGYKCEYQNQEKSSNLYKNTI